jgi:TonB family protein
VRRERILGDALFIDPGSEFYSVELAGRGVQGTVILVLDLTNDGQVQKAHVHTSSRSEELDAAAVRKSLTMTYQGNGKPPAAASLQVVFRRDTPESLQNKSCADFNVDAAWFRSAFPERPATDMPALRVTSMLVALNVNHQRKRVLDALPAAQEATVDGCAKNPELRFKDVFNRALKLASDAGIQAPPLRTQKPCTGPDCDQTDTRLPRSLLRTKIDEPVWLPNTIRITPVMPSYPKDLAIAGIQGQVVLHVALTPAGEIAEVRVYSNQSRAKALADAAIAHVRSMSFRPFAKLDQMPTILVVALSFDKDTEATLQTKTCADFNVDLTAWRSAQPQASVRAMRIFSFSSGVSEDMANATAAACNAHPQAPFMSELKKQMQDGTRSR